MPAKASLEPSATVSAIAGTRFHHASTARTVRVKGCPALWPVGVPCLPLGVPPRAVSPGSRTWSPAIGPGCTVRLLLEPVWGGALKSEQVIDTDPPAPMNVSGPLHTPLTKVMSSGVMLPAPVFASRAAWPVYDGMVLPLASVARIVTVTGVPATWGEAIGAITKWSAPAGSTVIAALVMLRMLPFDWSDTVMVWDPTVRSVGLSETKPLLSVPEGRVALPSLEV